MFYLLNSTKSATGLNFSIQPHASLGKISRIFHLTKNINLESPFKAVLLLENQQENLTRQHPTLPGGGQIRVDLPVYSYPRTNLDPIYIYNVPNDLPPASCVFDSVEKWGYPNFQYWKNEEQILIPAHPGHLHLQKIPFDCAVKIFPWYCGACLLFGIQSQLL